MTALTDAEVERRALALLERLSDDPKSRRRLLARQPVQVRDRLAVLDRSAVAARHLMPTEMGGGLPVDPPERIGPFRLTRPIGVGGMGSVWLAERDDGLYEQRVAVKFIHAELGRPGAERFAAERRLQAKLDAPSIARVIDGGVTAEGLAYVVMEHVDGESIEAAGLSRGARARVRLFADAANAVQHAHSRLVVHGDLKPSNIMVDRGGRVRLLDFGVARLVEADRPADGGRDEPAAAPGPLTSDFASPERLAGDPPSIADDIFALGVIFRDMTRDLADADLAAMAAKATAADPAQRYGSVAALIADLDRWSDRLPVSAQRNTLAYRTRLFLARHAPGVAATAAAILLLAAFAGVAAANYLAAERARAVAEQRFAEVRAISRYMLFDLYDRLADAPGTVQARAELAETARSYLDRLSASPGAPPDLRLEIAQGYRRLARVQGITSVASLGRPADALRSLDQSERIAREVLARAPRSAETLELLGSIQTDRWTLAPDNGDSASLNAKAHSYFSRALALDAGRPAAALGLLETDRNRAFDLIWGANRPKDAIPLLTHALAQLRERRLDSDEARRLEVALLNRLGDADYYAGDVSGSLGPYGEAEAIVDRRLAQGEALGWLALKGETAWNVSGSLGDLDQAPAALAKAAEGEAVMLRVLSYGPDARAEKTLLVLYAQDAGLLVALGRPRDAVAPSLRSVALREARARAAPEDAQRERDLAVGLETAAHVHAKAGLRPQACRLATRALTTWTRIDARGHLNRRDAANDLPAAARTRADYCGEPTPRPGAKKIS